MKQLIKQVKYLIEYLLFMGCIGLMHLIGFKRSATFCAFLGRKIGPYLGVTKVARRNIQDNLKLQNPDIIINKLWDNFGRFIGEFPFINIISQKEVEDIITIDGLENLSEYVKNNQPLLIFSGHFANWEIVMRVSDKFCSKMAVVYRHANNPYIDDYINSLRNKLNIKFILKGPNGLKDMVQAIKEGYTLVLLTDQKMKKGMRVPFFDKDVLTNFGIAKLALAYKYPIIPLQIVRSHNSNFKLTVYPALPVLDLPNNKESYYQIMVMINEYLEKWIKENPHQWLCFHKRWD